MNTVGMEFVINNVGLDTVLEEIMTALSIENLRKKILHVEKIMETTSQAW